jgi:hypothetical protein
MESMRGRAVRAAILSYLVSIHYQISRLAWRVPKRNSHESDRIPPDYSQKYPDPFSGFITNDVPRLNGLLSGIRHLMSAARNLSLPEAFTITSI